MIELKPGSYRLAENVSNPEPDRRHKHRWRKWEQWPAGMLLAVSDITTPPPEDSGVPHIPVLHIGRPGRGLDTISVRSEAGQLLAAHLVPVVEKPSDWLKRDHGINIAPSILDRLVQSGKITDADVKAAYEACIAEEPE